jgi:hypothetical protein
MLTLHYIPYTATYADSSLHSIYCHTQLTVAFHVQPQRLFVGLLPQILLLSIYCHKHLTHYWFLCSVSITIRILPQFLTVFLSIYCNKCSFCFRWLHCLCDQIRTETEAERCAEEGYNCVLCRPRDVPPPHLLPPPPPPKPPTPTKSPGNQNGCSEMKNVHTAVNFK